MSEREADFYRERIAPFLPPRALDFHAHVWTADQWIDKASGQPGADYMVTERNYTAADLIEDARRMFPDRDYSAVVFGQPTPSADTGLTNDYAAECGRVGGLYPLLVTGRGLMDPAQLKTTIVERGFFGYKVYLNWLGDDYGSVRVEDMIGPDEMRIADELGLIVLLHVPGAGRLADPTTGEAVRAYAMEYPRAKIVLAHCGRCYLPYQIADAVEHIRGLDNVYLDTAMVMDPMVLRIVLDEIGPERVLFATDLPVAAMRGRRVHVLDHWVDLVDEGYPESRYRVPTPGAETTYMAREIAAAVVKAAQSAGLTEQTIHKVFFDNGMNLLAGVMDGAQLRAARERWKGA